MENFRAVWRGLAPAKRLMVGFATLGVIAAVFAVSMLGTSKTNSLLYSGLDAAAAGDVVAALEASGAAYDVRGSSIYVEADARDRLRMTLAAGGLPALGDQGYELLDSLSGFGTTSQMFDAAYWRAKEGELARTIVSAPHIKSARVHISKTAARAFQRDVSPTAAVTVGTVSGGLTPDQARALRFLVASAVSGMSPSDVSVIDKVAGLVASGDTTTNQGGEDPRVTALKAKVERLLEAHVGYGNAVVEVSIEAITESALITETRFDPETRVAISTEVEERSSASENGDTGQVTVASNLPDGEAAQGGGSTSEKVSETHERTNFEVSETRREISRGPGDIRRLTVAVLVNSVVDTENNETAPKVSSEAEMQSLRNLVETAVGYDAARGDTITLESLPFEPLDAVGSTALADSSMLSQLDLTQLVQYMLVLVAVIAFGLLVVKPIFAANPTTLPAIGELQGPGEAVVEGIEGMQPQDNEGFPELDFSPPAELPAFEPIADLGGGNVGEQSPTDRLRNLLDERQSETLQVLQNWLDGERRPAGDA